MSKSSLCFALCTALTMSTPLFAVDGVKLIDQPIVIATGGFPYHITAPGSYRLSGDLLAPGTSAIQIAASNVTLDLNGFTVACAGCSGVPGIQSTGFRTVITNGIVTGFNGPAGAGLPVGILFASSDAPGDHTASIDHVNADSNTIGILAVSGVSLSVSNSSASWNASIGISAGPAGTLTVTNSKINQNGLDGILMGSGVVTASAIAHNGLIGAGLRGGIGVGGNSSAATITNNAIAGNAVFGIFAQGFDNPVVGFGSNTFNANSVDVGAVSTFFSMHNNACAGGLC